jgi:hypothetical protein
MGMRFIAKVTRNKNVSLVIIKYILFVKKSFKRDIQHVVDSYYKRIMCRSVDLYR